MFPFAESQKEGNWENLTRYQSSQLAAVVAMVEQIPSHLFVLDGAAYAVLVSSLAAIRDILDVWRADGTEGRTVLTDLEGISPLNPVTLIRRALAKCPDEMAAQGTTELAFIADEALRDTIRLDISAANQNLSRGEWKGATVLAGSAVEALLLWALQEHDKANPGAVAVAVGALRPKPLSRDPGADLEGPGWHLHEYVEVAAHLRIIKPDSAAQVRLAKDARNLVHPGRAARVGQKCDRGTALTAIAAVAVVVRDLTP